MFLEYWMIVVLLTVFALGMYHLYKIGYHTAYVTGGLYGHNETMKIVKEVVSKEDMEKIRKYIIEKYENV